METTDIMVGFYGFTVQLRGPASKLKATLKHLDDEWVYRVFFEGIVVARQALVGSPKGEGSVAPAVAVSESG